eukprot:6187676-Pleurochrysis_carterae.AAC.1
MLPRSGAVPAGACLQRCRRCARRVRAGAASQHAVAFRPQGLSTPKPAFVSGVGNADGSASQTWFAGRQMKVSGGGSDNLFHALVNNTALPGLLLLRNKVCSSDNCSNPTSLTSVY